MNTCKECIHAEMCKWIDELEGRGCDFFDGEQKPESVTEFADRCRECGARYGKLLKQKCEDQIVEIMAKYIKDNSTPMLIELVIKAIKKVEGKE